jgi:hypothetical protein
VNYRHVLCFNQFYLLCLQSSQFFFLYFSIIPTHSCYTRFIVQLCKTFLHNITQDLPSITLLPPFLTLIVLQVSYPSIIFLRPCIKRAISVNEHFRNKLRDRDSKKISKRFPQPAPNSSHIALHCQEHPGQLQSASMSLDTHSFH